MSPLPLLCLPRPCLRAQPMRARRECHRRKLRPPLYPVPRAGAPTESLAPRGGPPAPPPARALIP
eukprot:2137390-Prymnesium_polylepis.1